MFKTTILSLSLIAFIPVLAFEIPSPGTVITKENIDQFSYVIDTPIVELINEEAISITVGNTFTIPPNPQFLEQTLKHKGTVKVDAKTGHILNYQQGLPFYEEPDINDSQAGLKIA